jgi:hypothetical protein
MIRFLTFAGNFGLALTVAACATPAVHNASTTVTVTAPPVTVTQAAPTASPVTVTPAAPVPMPVDDEAVPVTDPATPISTTFGPRGAYAIGEPRGGLTEVIPPGRYRASGVDGAGFINHCSTVLCGMSSSDPSVTKADIVESTMILEIPSADVAVYLFDVTLTPLV